MSTILPNMLLELPVRGAPGSGLWADDSDENWQRLDAHDHSSGKGLPVGVAGLSIDGDLSFGGLYAPTNLNRITFSSIAALASNNKSLFVSDGSGGLTNGELYWRSNAGNNVRVTSGSALNVAAFTGGIGGDYTSVSAALNYDNSNVRYTLRQGGGTTWARLATGEVRILETSSTDSVYAGLAAPAALAASYTMTLPLALPASTRSLSLSSAGVIATGASQELDANNSYTVSGTGDYKHGDRTFILGGAAFRQKNNNNALQPNYADQAVGTGWQFFAPPNDSLRATIPLRVGDRIKSITWFFNKRGSATSLTMQLASVVYSTQATTAVVTTVDTASTSAVVSTTESSSPLPLTLTSGTELVIGVTSSNTSCFFYGAVIVYDRP